MWGDIVRSIYARVLYNSNAWQSKDLTLNLLNEKKLCNKINQNINTLRIQQDDYTSGVVIITCEIQEKKIYVHSYRDMRPQDQNGHLLMMQPVKTT